MTLIIKKPTGAKLVCRRTWQPMDPDAAAYITAVETADGQALEERVKIAIDNFVLGCKADGIWSAIKASCILAGARTLNGALVPLVGTAPTSFNFVAGDYNRKAGLVGNGSTKYLNSNRAANADPVGSFHLSVYATSVQNRAEVRIGSNSATSGSSIGPYAGQVYLVNRGPTASVPPSYYIVGTQAELIAGFAGTTRPSNALHSHRLNRVSRGPFANTAQSPGSESIYVFANNNNDSSISDYSNARLAFYSIGESLDLALLDARVTDLINAFGAAIP